MSTKLRKQSISEEHPSFFMPPPSPCTFPIPSISFPTYFLICEKISPILSGLHQLIFLFSLAHSFSLPFPCMYLFFLPPLPRKCVTHDFTRNVHKDRGRLAAGRAGTGAIAPKRIIIRSILSFFRIGTKMRFTRCAPSHTSATSLHPGAEVQPVG